MAAERTLYSAHILRHCDKEIRILQLQPGCWTDRVSCTLKVVPLYDKQLEYEALSYVWGSKANPVEISLEDHIVPVTNNLFKVLRRLRRATEIRTLWVDALCINQSDTIEKAEQVTVMAAIYKCSTLVWIWLDDYESEPSTPRDTQTVEEANADAWYKQNSNSKLFDVGTAALMVVMELARSEKRHLDDFPLFVADKSFGEVKFRVASKLALQALQAFTRVLDADWWRRVWIIQECVFASKAMALFGSLQIPWATFSLAAECLQIHTKCCMKLTANIPGLMTVFEQFIIVVMELTWTWMIHHSDKHQSGTTPLYDLMCQYRAFNATDPRDKLYALLSFLPDGNTDIKPSPDYTITTKEAYKRAVMYDVGQTKELSILRGQRKYSAPSPNFPTWIYDWSAFVYPGEWHRERQRLRNSEYKASAMEPASILCDHNYILQLDGIFLDSVCAVGPELRYPSNKPEDDVKAWRKLADLPAKDCERYAGGGDILQAFWRTVTRDYTLNEKAEFERIKNSERHVLEATAWWERFKNGSQPVSKEPDDFGNLLYNMSAGLKFFLTTKGFIGLGIPQVNDKVFVLRGSNVPLVLQSHENVGHFSVVGDCYVHGFMDGELLKRPWQRVLLM
jgi:hypothetical protein